VASTLDACSLKRLLADAQLVASELVTNAVQATGITGPSPRRIDLRDLALIRLQLLVFSDSLIVGVWDRETAPPTPQGPVTPDAENGRGLLIVEALSQQWNYYGSVEGGKWVWAKLVIPPEPEPLPKRVRPTHPPTVRVRQTSSKLAMLRRVQDGLRRVLAQEMKYPPYALHATRGSGYGSYVKMESRFAEIYRYLAR
jgi:anti-sigma regulatory factor (Ser/Thr protein kinase)